jgi:hypothetical protein
MLTKLLLGKSTKLWDMYLDQALFACRVRTHATTKTSPFYLVYGKHPRLLGDANVPIAADARIADHEARIQSVYTARHEATQAMYERALQAKELQDEFVKEHDLTAGEWVLVRHENPQKFESKWFGPYQINERMALGTYRLQDPEGKELQALVHGNRLIKAQINLYEALEKLWASPATKDALRKTNKWVDLVKSDADGTCRLERLLLGESELPIEQVPMPDEAPASPPPPPPTHQDHENEKEYPRKRRKRVATMHPMRQSSRIRNPIARYED